jgi:O-antigen ligase
MLLVPVVAWGFYLGNTIPGHYMFQLVDWMCFGVLALAGLNHTSLKPVFKANAIATVVCLGLGLYQFFTAPERYPGSILLHQNITSQFLAVSLILQIASRSYWLVAPTLVHIYLLYCRSIWVALAVVGVLYLFRKNKPLDDIKSVLKQIPVAVFIVLVLTLSTSSVDPVSPTHNGIHTSKGDSTDIRLERWKNTIEMIKANPLGVGPGNFEWGYTIYGKTDPEHKPRLNIRSPHNGYLELAVEYGLPAAVLFVLAMAIVLWKVYPSPLVASIIILNAVDAMFAFPMELGFTFYIAAFILGIGLKKHFSSYRPVNSQVKAVLVIALFVITVFGLRMTLAERWEETKTIRGFEKACALKPADWQACINLGVNQLKNKQYEAAVKTFDGILKDRPHMHPAIYLKAQSLKAWGKNKEAVEVYKQYRTYFK